MARRLVALASAMALIAACRSFGTAADPSTTSDAGPDAGVVGVEAGGDAGATCTTAADVACEVKCGDALCGSCREIIAAVATSNSGFYVIKAKGGRSVPVYCDMKTAGAGWTLAARSHANPPGEALKNFGWGSSVGDVMDDSKPYSLDVITTLATPPTEILFGRRNEHFEWGPQVYRNVLPTDFFAAGVNRAFDVSNTLTTVTGDCKGGTFQSWMGWVKHADFYFIRDVDRDDGAYGLFPDGWEVNDQMDCASGGDLNPGTDRTAGMLFVR